MDRGYGLGRGYSDVLAVAAERLITFFGTSPLHFFTLRGWQNQNDGNSRLTNKHVLDQLQVRLLTSLKDKARCDQLIVEHHYLKDATLVGEQLRYVATYKGQWLAVATWSGAAFH